MTAARTKEEIDRVEKEERSNRSSRQWRMVSSGEEIDTVELSPPM